MVKVKMIVVIYVSEIDNRHGETNITCTNNNDSIINLNPGNTQHCQDTYYYIPAGSIDPHDPSSGTTFNHDQCGSCLSSWLYG